MTQEYVTTGLAVDTDLFRHVVGHLASGVTVLTTRVDERDHGMTASSVTSLSMDPPALLVCLNRKSSVTPVLLEHQAFCVNVLTASQSHIAEHFSGRDGSRGAARYRDASWQEMPSGALGAPSALALIDCKLEEVIERHSHTILIGHPLSIATRDQTEPLLYWHGAYRLLSSIDRVLTQATRSY